ncbi:MAG: MBL fold metallo-hydrolase [Cytophagales bacterium]|nr:MBL fold metallo-hydrolase [Cytophagales bacterium]
MSEFGGNTTCFYLELLAGDKHHGTSIIFDAGTGIRQLGKDMMSGNIPRKENILIHFSHFHWDHIQGLPFFIPAYLPDQKIAIFSPHYLADETKKLENVFEKQMHSEFFPVQLENMGSNMCFFTNEDFQKLLSLDNKVTFTYYKNNHPGDAYSFKLSGYGKTVVISTDFEHGETLDEDFVTFCEGADLLIHEAQYTDKELQEHRGWGHSSFSQAMEVAEKSGAKNLYITHHDPDHDDVFLREIERDCQQRFKNCFLAREGEEVVV